MMTVTQNCIIWINHIWLSLSWLIKISIEADNVEVIPSDVWWETQKVTPNRAWQFWQKSQYIMVKIITACLPFALKLKFKILEGQLRLEVFSVQRLNVSKVVERFETIHSFFSPLSVQLLWYSLGEIVTIRYFMSWFSIFIYFLQSIIVDTPKKRIICCQGVW